MSGDIFVVLETDESSETLVDRLMGETRFLAVIGVFSSESEAQAAGEASGAIGYAIHKNTLPAQLLTSDRRVADWQPMASAPKDGTMILAVHRGSRDVIAVKFSSYRGPNGKSELGVYLVEDGSNVSHGYAHWQNLMHWMPFPTAPPE